MLQSALKFRTGDLPKDVREYCARHGLRDHLRAAYALAIDVYGPVKDITARLQPDPDGGEERIVVDIAVSGDVNDVLHRKAEYTRRRVKGTSPEVRDRIRVLYHIE